MNEDGEVEDVQELSPQALQLASLIQMFNQYLGVMYERVSSRKDSTNVKKLAIAQLVLKKLEELSLGVEDEPLKNMLTEGVIQNLKILYLQCI